MKRKGGDRLYAKYEALLNKYHVTTYRVAKETGIQSSTFTAWKQGTYTPKVDKIQKIADFFGVPISYFYQEE